MTAAYNINNSTGHTVIIQNSDGVSVFIRSSGTVALTDQGYQSAIAIFGPSNVTLAGGSGSSNQPYAYTPLGLLTMTLNSSVAQALAPPAGATTVQISVAGNAVNYRDDGTPPTSSVGIPAAAGLEFFLSQTNLANVKFIAQTGTATLTMSFYK